MACYSVNFTFTLSHFELLNWVLWKNKTHIYSHMMSVYPSQLKWNERRNAVWPTTSPLGCNTCSQICNLFSDGSKRTYWSMVKGFFRYSCIVVELVFLSPKLLQQRHSVLIHRMQPKYAIALWIMREPVPVPVPDWWHNCIICIGWRKNSDRRKTFVSFHYCAADCCKQLQTDLT